MEYVPKELTARLEARIGHAADALRALRDEINRLDGERERLVKEQAALRSRVAQLEHDVARLQHLEQESADIMGRHEALTERVQGLLSLLQGHQ